jgi:hypothetical protein
MLVRNLEGERLGRVVSREQDTFRIQQPAVADAERYVVEDADVMEIRGTEIILREGPATVLLEREYERRKQAGVPLRNTAEGWRTRPGGPAVSVDQELRVGMAVVDVEGRAIGTLVELGEGAFDLRCANGPQLATVHLGDVLNVLPTRVVVRKGSEVLKNRRDAHEADPAPVG